MDPQWNNHQTPPSSGFQPTNTLPPMLSLTNRFKDLDHKNFSRLIKFHTGHTHIGEYYRWFIRTEDLSCPCSHTIQTRCHILRECLRYYNQQPSLGMGRNTQLERLVGTEKGIKCPVKFISTTKAMDKHKTTNTRTHNPNIDPTGVER